MTLKEIRNKYIDIEDKIPSIFKSYDDAGIQMAQDICMYWDIDDYAIIRVMSLIDIYTNRKYNLCKHMNRMLTYAALYPTVQKVHNEYPEYVSELLSKRKNK